MGLFAWSKYATSDFLILFLAFMVNIFGRIKNANLINESQIVTRIINHKPERSNIDVQYVEYLENSNNIKFIPSSIFTTFPNIAD